MTPTAFRYGAMIGAMSAALLAAAASPAAAETLSFKADLAPVAGTDSKAAGTVDVTYDTGSKKLTWQGSYRGIGTYATAANMYGPSNNIVVRLRSIDSPFDGIAIVSEKQAPDLIAGRWFIVLSTAAAPTASCAARSSRRTSPVSTLNSPRGRTFSLRSPRFHRRNVMSETNDMPAGSRRPYPAERRAGEIILKSNWQRAVFIAGLVGALVLALAFSFLR